MSNSGRSVLDLKSFSKNQIVELFKQAKACEESSRREVKKFQSTVALIFFEPSTRTRISFETACVRAGYYPILFDCGQGTSLIKGESEADTILNIAAMEPSGLIIRASEHLDLQDLSKKISMPMISAGWGISGHPTQALLDAYTVWLERAELANERVLFVGDIAHSRVAASNFELWKTLGAQVAICGPEVFLPQPDERIQQFTELNEALQWASIVVSLRVQLERHHEKCLFAKEDYLKYFTITEERLKNLSSQALILHPGPVNLGVDLSQEAIKDSRIRILKQVTHGVYLREALVEQVFGECHT